MLTRIAAVLVLALSLLAVAGCEDTVTLDNYEQIKVDMDLIEVESIMGGAGELQVASGVGIGAEGLVESQGGTGDTKDYLWGDENQGILVKVKDGKVVYKQKFGLN